MSENNPSIFAPGEYVKRRQCREATIAAEAAKSVLNRIVVGGRHFSLFALAGVPPYILFTYLMYHFYTLCIYITIYIFGGPPAMSKTRPPTTMSNRLCVFLLL